MKAKSIIGNSSEEIKTTLESCMAEGFKPTLAFVFISIKQNIEAICQLLESQAITIFGATSAGEFVDGNIGSGSTAILLLDIAPSNFLLLLEDYHDKDPEALTQAMAKKATEQFKNPSFILSGSIDVLSEESVVIGEAILRAIETVTGKETVIWGGRAGDDFAFKETIVFTNHQLSIRGILLLVLDGDKILLKGLAASGQKPVGTEKTITKAVGNRVYELDHQPATEMVIKYLGLNLNKKEGEGFLPDNITFSLSRDKGDPVMRGVGLFNEQDKSISFVGGIKTGDKIRFTLPPDFEVVKEVSRNAEAIKNDMPGAEALLMFSCISRLGQFGPLIGDEIDGIRNAFNVPMAGFFCYGEFGRANNGDNEFHNTTCCWVALKEK